MVGFDGVLTLNLEWPVSENAGTKTLQAATAESSWRVYHNCVGFFFPWLQGKWTEGDTVATWRVKFVTISLV